MTAENSADLFLYIKALKNITLHFRYDPDTNMRAIIALSTTGRGPSLGGCRCIEYASTSDAIGDAVRLAHGMSYKAALANLPLAGGKSVIMEPENFAGVTQRDALFQTFGRFVDELGGSYITAMDSGTTTKDMASICKQTPFVASQVRIGDADDDPSPLTARGILRGIQAAVEFKLKRDSLAGLHVAVQGVGKVGYHLCAGLHKLGAKLTVCDVNTASTQQCADEFGATIVTNDEITSCQCDVFAPCALGGILNDKTIGALKASIVAGGANDQLAAPHHAEQLHQRGILYAPDYAINAGGLVHCFAAYSQSSTSATNSKIEKLYDTLMEIFQRAEKEEKTTIEVANIMAEERLK